MPKNLTVFWPSTWRRVARRIAHISYLSLSPGGSRRRICWGGRCTGKAPGCRWDGSISLGTPLYGSKDRTKLRNGERIFKTPLAGINPQYLAYALRLPFVQSTCPNLEKLSRSSFHNGCLVLLVRPLPPLHPEVLSVRPDALGVRAASGIEPLRRTLTWRFSLHSC